MPRTREEITTSPLYRLTSCLSAVIFINNIYRLRNIIRISYKKLWILLIDRNISTVQFRRDLNIASGTMTKMRRNEEVALSILLRICDYLDCNIGDICDAIRDNDDYPVI